MRCMKKYTILFRKSYMYTAYCSSALCTYMNMKEMIIIIYDCTCTLINSA